MDWGDDNDTHVRVLFLAGRQFAQDTRVKAEEISAVFLITEVWAVNRQRDELILDSVETQPDRRKCLSVVMMEMRKKGKTLDHAVWLAEISSGKAE
jgi:hypothetical protein